ncbi:MAG: NAD(P)-binding domain-containing protein [Pseudomonadota bacterium]
MSAINFAESLQSYAGFIASPVVENVQVNSAHSMPDGFLLTTSEGPVKCRTLVVASGGAARPVVPPLADAIPTHVFQTDPAAYKRPSDLPEGGFLVVGASASGAQIARELRLSGRRVTLAVGSHIRLPRRYRGRDIEWWLDAIGALDESLSEVNDLARARRTPSPQLIGGPDPVDLEALDRLGVEITGRLADIRDGHALFSGGLTHVCQAADLKLGRLLDRIDLWAAERSPGAALLPIDRPSFTSTPASPRLGLDLGTGEIKSIVWATGFRPAHDWLRDLPVFDRRGRIVHDGGVVAAAPGLYVLGLPFLRRRRSLQISGAGPDARDIARHLDAFLRQSAAA